MRIRTVLGAIALAIAGQLPGGVRYRGVFINDEDWCLRPWCEARFGKERGICAEAYREIFAASLSVQSQTSVRAG